MDSFIKMPAAIKPSQDFSPLSLELVESTIIAMFQKVVEKCPESIAVTSDRGRLNYQELNARSNSLAHAIQEYLPDSKEPVAILFGNTIDGIVALLAVMKAGHPFVAVDPSFSVTRVGELVSDFSVGLFITNGQYLLFGHEVLDDQNTIALLNSDDVDYLTGMETVRANILPDDPMMIAYTSGSTGRAKGVVWTHRQILSNFIRITNNWCISSSDRFLLLTGLGVGASWSSLYVPFITGAAICLYDLKRQGIASISSWLLSEGVTIFRSPKPVFKAIFSEIESTAIFPSLRVVAMGSQAVTHEDVGLYRKHTLPECIFVNNFASTEAGIIANFYIDHQMQLDSQALPVGTPLNDKEILIIDNDGLPVQVGQVGEIVVRSKYIPFGYLNYQDLNERKFRVDLQDRDYIFFYSGDVGRWNENGQLEHFGRKDNVVKIRGYRIDLQEIENALREISEVKDACVVARAHTNRPDEKYLAAYVIQESVDALTVKNLRLLLAEKLPDYMVPAFVVFMEKLPFNINGKVDRNALPEIPERRELQQDDLPGDSMEEILVGVWKKVLNLNKIGVHDNFFEIGGDSLVALQMTLEVERLISKTIPQGFFQDPTISSLAGLLATDMPIEAEKEKFSEWGRGLGNQRSNNTKSRKKLVQKLITRKYSLNDVDRLVDKLVARHIMSKSFVEANQWIVRWSQNAIVRDYLYARRYTLFTEWVSSLRDCDVPLPEAFQMNILNNMKSGQVRYLGTNFRDQRSNLDAYKKSEYPYLRTFGETLDAISVGQMSEHFPIQGLEHLEQAYKQGKGVILVSFHGMPGLGGAMILARYLGLDFIPTISYRVPARQRQQVNAAKLISQAANVAMNSEIALFGQKRLLEGKVIQFFNDTSDPWGKRYEIILGGRKYEIKGGFAELSLNTGAVVIPYFMSGLPDGRIQINLDQPFEHGNGDRAEMVRELLDAYTQYINRIWSTHPETIKWDKIKYHFGRPPAA